VATQGACRNSVDRSQVCEPTNYSFHNTVFLQTSVKNTRS
jgi:hypothetical protein